MNHFESFLSILFFGPAYGDSYLAGIGWVLGNCLILKVPQVIPMGTPGRKPRKSPHDQALLYCVSKGAAEGWYERAQFSFLILCL